MRAPMAAIVAARPAPRATHGPSHGEVNGRGRTNASTQAAATPRPASVASTSRTGGARRVNDPTSEITSPRLAAMATTIDHAGASLHAPNKSEPAPKRLHGNAVEMTAAAKATVVATRARCAGSRSGTSGSDGSGPIAASRHSGPSTVPRTGTAHPRHNGRPHRSQVATEARDGCDRQRSVPRDARSSVTTVEAYRRRCFPSRATRDPTVTACAVFNCGRLTHLDEVPSVRAVADARVAVLASGGGTNLQALLHDPVVGPRVVLAVSDPANTPPLERARSHEVETVFLDPSAHDDRVSFDRALLEVLLARSIDVVALAGFMRIVGPVVVRAFAGRILNVHPALLQAFPGTTSVADALAWGVKLTGVTVHFVDEEVDHGPIVFQDAVPVLPSDDWDSLEERVHEAEHRLLPAAIRALVEGRITIEGRIVRVLEKAPA